MVTGKKWEACFCLSLSRNLRGTSAPIITANCIMLRERKLYKSSNSKSGGGTQRTLSHSSVHRYSTVFNYMCKGFFPKWHTQTQLKQEENKSSTAVGFLNQLFADDHCDMSHQLNRLFLRFNHYKWNKNNRFPILNRQNDEKREHFPHCTLKFFR